MLIYFYEIRKAIAWCCNTCSYLYPQHYSNGGTFRAVPILPANFFEKLEAKSKEQTSGKIGEKLEKWVSENCNLAYFALQRWRYSTRIVTNRIKSTCASGKTAKRLRYSNRAITML